MSERVRVEALGVVGDTVEVDGERGHHLARVARVLPGQSLGLFDGRGREARATVLRVHRGSVVVELVEVTDGVVADAAKVLWLQGFPKGDKLETVVRQATELGVSAVWPVFCARSIPKPSGQEEARAERLRRVAEEAARQCGRADVPEVRAAAPLEDALRSLGDEHPLRLCAWERATDSLSSASAAVPEGGCAVLAGPEGGLDASEVALGVSLGFRPVTLGPRVLRAETVAPALLALLSLLRGDLRPAK